ncbi:coiled-coil and C2 domain-containing protein 1-like [Halichondria panicea]|uniref:coiled-coil and C2 domain-containing protein 1-like n=1 Tax=Halichondria panicea TaxID=6063 RepID=UPI00312BAA3B
MAPSQAALRPTSPMLSVYPFQCICADYFHYQGCNYIVIIDQYSNWPIVERAKDGATGLINVLRHTFATYGIPDELSSDGGPEFIAHTTRQFLHTWGVHHRLSSVAYPHSNCRAEVGVKTIKRLITGNVGKDGAITIDAFQQAILQYRNTPDPATKLSPAMCIFGRPTKDLIPILPGKYRPQSTWRDTLNLREEALRKRHLIQQEKWSEHTKPLTPLRVGDTVRIQNQTGHHPTKWDRTGIVIEVRQFHQYLIRIDGSGLRNRKFVRKITPVHQPAIQRSILDDLAHVPFSTTTPPTQPPSPSSDKTPPGTAEDRVTPADPNPPADPTPPPAAEPPPPLSPIPLPAPLRRSTRVMKPRTWKAFKSPWLKSWEEIENIDFIDR